MSELPFNRLTNEGAEALALLAEECAEVIQIVGKILRHGINSSHPDSGESNRALLEQELGDVRAAEEIVLRIFDIQEQDVVTRKVGKLDRVQRYLHYVKLGRPAKEGDSPV